MVQFMLFMYVKEPEYPIYTENGFSYVIRICK